MRSRHRSLAVHVDHELRTARAAQHDGDVRCVWYHLERAHVLSQPSVVLHVLVHWRMLVLAITTFDVREIFGQAVRLVVAGPGSALGRYPVGNVGTTRVGLLTPMPIAAELARLCAAGVSADEQ
jgi:hypothetical protein